MIIIMRYICIYIQQKWLHQNNTDRGAKIRVYYMVINRITLNIYFTFNHKIKIFKIKKEKVKVSMVDCQCILHCCQS